uniref:Si:ch211-67e16.11 n=1 Tax=Hippocampus comes TaxID=109280 RepID=A0A3Q2YDH4_HIPCM
VLAILPDSYSSSGLISSKFRSAFGIGRLANGRESRHRYQAPFLASVSHDAVLVLDPSPSENFGHPVALFYVDFNVTKKRCSHLDGIYLEECLTQALKGRCQNQLKRWQAGPERLMEQGHSWLVGGAPRRATFSSQVSGRLCEVHFLPLVVGVGDSNRTQRLRCVHTEFSRCPQLVPMGSPSLPVSSCELNKNTRRCHQQPLATHLSCRLYQTCDHAVLISGWRQQMTFQRHVQNLQRFYRMLRINGFHKDHIKTFFASSGHNPEELEGAYSATEKAVIRNHVSYVCRKQHCADSLVLYLNSPTRNDGTMLLWDANLNGIADLKERYSVNELLTDLAGCRATRVLLFVDQSYSGVLSKRLRGSQKHLNGLLNITLAGAPCNATPPLTDSEMRRWYQGCQNLPTALWHRK